MQVSNNMSAPRYAGAPAPKFRGEMEQPPAPATPAEPKFGSTSAEAIKTAWDALPAETIANHLDQAKALFEYGGWFSPAKWGSAALVGGAAHSGLQTFNKFVNTNGIKRNAEKSLATLAKAAKIAVPGAADPVATKVVKETVEVAEGAAAAAAK